MDYEAALKELDYRIKAGKKMIDTGAALERLMNNRDFKEVILEGYFREEAIRLVSAKADVAFQSEASQASIIKQIDAIGCVQDYLRLLQRYAAQAEKEVADHEETREEILAEGDEV